MNKKFLLGVAFISVIGLSGCHFNNKISNHIQTKVEQSTQQKLSSHQNSQASVSSSDELESQKNVIKQSDNTRQLQNNDQNNNQSNNQNVGQQNKSQPNNQNINQSNKNQQNNNNAIPNGNAAGIYLKQQLKYGNNSNIVAGNDPSYDGNDQDGNFYTVSLMDMSDRIQGKTGSMGIYRVYSNGKIVQIAQ